MHSNAKKRGLGPTGITASSEKYDSLGRSCVEPLGLASRGGAKEMSEMQVGTHNLEAFQHPFKYLFFLPFVFRMA
jgi:hypothetical protein